MMFILRRAIESGISYTRTKSVFSTDNKSLQFNYPNRQFNLLSIINPGVTVSKTHSLKRRAILRYPRKALYGIVADINSYQKYIPWCTGSRITGRVRCDHPREIILADLTVGFGPLRETYTSSVELIPHKKVVARISPSESGPLSELLATWEFSPFNPSSSRNVPYAKEAYNLGKSSRKQSTNTSLLDGDVAQDQELTEVVFHTRFCFKNPLYSAACDLAISDSNICDRILNAFKERALRINSLNRTNTLCEEGRQ